jgi:hypothetical protein
MSSSGLWCRVALVRTTFWRNVFPSSSILKMEARYSSEVLVVMRPTRRHIPHASLRFSLRLLACDVSESFKPSGWFLKLSERGSCQHMSVESAIISYYEHTSAPLPLGHVNTTIKQQYFAVAPSVPHRRKRHRSKLGEA